jgi:menaquinone-dependent protoporphyrinogen oxidase
MFILVGYASEHGSTRGIAQRVAATLSRHGNHVQVVALDRVPDAGGYYDAFVLGSAVHGQAWLPLATDWLRRNGEGLGSRPVWLFSVGMPAALRGPLRALSGKEEPKIRKAFPPGIRLRDHRLFSGVFEADHVPFLGRLIFRLVGGRYGDYRDWAEIDAWAEDIASHLEGRTRPAAPVGSEGSR